ncbi:MAG: histidine--tRNA ligase [Acholeplasmatales bacterium]|nr:MAG: histidine--tRNA ligase [Acholeplasmatales bacterium]
MLQKMKGTYDLHDTMPLVHDIERAIQAVSRLFQYQEIRTPHFELSELYHRSVGESSDIVSKETYDFKDRGGRAVTLRPEGTAGVVRAYVENKLYAEPIKPQKYYYVGSMFRYERPQKGRFREFRQFGAEAFGSEHPELDAEVIAYAITFLRALKLKNLTVHVNSLGDATSKTAYRAALKAHIAPHLETLCTDCQTRYHDNPLRILDCKVDTRHEALQTAPKPLDYLTEPDRQHFDAVIALLKAMDIAYTIDNSLVRGLDYYTHTVFEIKVDPDLLGNQNTICGGGRYNHLVESLGGPSTPAVGFAFGLERLMVALEAAGLQGKVQPLYCYVAALDESSVKYAMALMQSLRMRGLTCNMGFERKSLKAQFKQSAHQHARFVIILGEAEIASKTVQIKDQTSGDSFSVPLDEVYSTIMAQLSTASDCETCGHKGASS